MNIATRYTQRRLKELLDLLGDALIEIEKLDLEHFENYLMRALQLSDAALAMPTHNKSTRVRSLIKRWQASTNKKEIQRLRAERKRV